MNEKLRCVKRCSYIFNDSQKLLKTSEKQFYPTFSSFQAKLSLKKLFLKKYKNIKKNNNKKKNKKKIGSDSGF